jgi:predicted O-methyltransferase YrrM
MPHEIDFRREPKTDPTEIFRLRDSLYVVDLAAAALTGLDFFSWLSKKAATKETICQGLGIQERSADVMLMFFVALGWLEKENEVFAVTELAREFLVAGSPWNLAPYYGALKERPVCKDMLAVLRTGKPANWGSLKDEKEWAKAMEGEAFARNFTAAMDCRGAYLGPAMARKLNLKGFTNLLDIAGGSGVYACAVAANHPHLKATVLEKSPVDKIAGQAIAARGFAERVSVAVGDMFVDPFPTGYDAHLFSNVLHDWDEPLVKKLLAKSFQALPEGGMLIVHDAHINAEKTGPLPVAAYSALLMNISEGKCYSITEMNGYLREAGFSRMDYFPTAADRSVITALKEKP